MTSGIGNSNRGNSSLSLNEKIKLTVSVVKSFNRNERLSENEGLTIPFSPRMKNIFKKSTRYLEHPENGTQLMLIARKHSKEINASKLYNGYYVEPLNTDQELTPEHFANAQYVADKLCNFVIKEELVKEKDSVLDLCSGAGFFVKALNDKNIKTVGIEGEEKFHIEHPVENNFQGVLDIGRERITGLSGNAVFDCIFMNAPPTADDTSDAQVRTLKKYLKNDGRLILSIPTNILMQAVFSLKDMQKNPEKKLGKNWSPEMKSTIQFAEALHKYFNVEKIYDAVTEKAKTGINELIGGGFAFVVVLKSKENIRKSSHTSARKWRAFSRLC